MASKKLKLGGWLMAVSLLAVLVGCGGDQISTKPAGEKKEEAVAPPPAEEEGKETKLVWSYDPTNKRDPFRIPEDGGVKPPNPFTSYDLNQMWIDGIIIGAGGKNVAHIVLLNNREGFVKVGDLLGLNSGVIKEIRSERKLPNGETEPAGILVEEQYLDPVDPTKIRIVDKFLRMETESAPAGLLSP